jgi:hypothetical protein
MWNFDLHHRQSLETGPHGLMVSSNISFIHHTTMAIGNGKTHGKCPFFCLGLGFDQGMWMLLYAAADAVS